MTTCRPTAYATNALPVRRKDTTEADIELWRARLLEEGAVLILFPEDTRSCYSTHAAWPPERHPPRPGRLHLIIGPTLRFAR